MSSVGSMNGKEILANVIALGILVITVAANVLIQVSLLCQIDTFGPSLLIVAISITLMLLLLATLISLAVTVPTAKRSLEIKYQEQHKRALREEEVLKRREAFTIDNQKGEMMKYLVMAETSSPQFVMARSVLCTTSAVICWLAAIILAFIFILNPTSQGQGASPYKKYTKRIFYVQSNGVAVGTIAPTLRWFVSMTFKCSTTNWNSFRKEFEIGTHWIQTLVDLRESFSTLQTRQDKYRKYLHDAKWFTLSFCIGFQILLVMFFYLRVKQSSQEGS